MNTHPMDYAAIEAQPGLAGNIYVLAPVMRTLRRTRTHGRLETRASLPRNPPSRRVHGTSVRLKIVRAPASRAQASPNP
jgi:hypothetical protein